MEKSQNLMYANVIWWAGKVQVSLVWNARDEDSIQADRLNKMAEVWSVLSQPLGAYIFVKTLNSHTQQQWISAVD